MRTARIVLTVAVALVIASPLWAGEKKPKEKKAPPCPAAQRVEKITEGLSLTDEQKTKLDAIKKEFGPKLAEAIKASEILTPEQKKARDEAAKAAKAAGKKGKEMKDAIDAAVKLTPDQQAKGKEAKKLFGAMEKDLREKVEAVLTADQKEQLKKKAGEKKGKK